MNQNAVSSPFSVNYPQQSRPITSLSPVHSSLFSEETEEVKKMKLEELEKFKKLDQDEKYLFVVEQGLEDPKSAIKLLALWLRSIDQKKTA